MRYEIQLVAHNGVAGKNSVEPFAGHLELLDEYDREIPDADKIFTENSVEHDGRVFTFAYREDGDDFRRYHFREKVETEPTEWAKAQRAS